MLQLLDRLASGSAKGEQQLAQPADRASVLLGCQRDGERPHDRRSNGVAKAVERLDGCIVGLAQMEDNVADDLAGRKLVENRLGNRPERRPAFITSLRHENVEQRLRRNDIAKQRPPLDFIPRDLANGLPSRRFRFETQQVLYQRKIQTTYRFVAHRSPPCLDAVRRIV